MIESANLKNTAAKGLFWSAIERFGAQGIQFVFGIAITRILLPADYGLVGMILIFMALGQTLVDSGFGAALIWKKEPTPSDYSSVFYFNITISLVLYAIFFFLAPYIADFYNEPKLINITRVLSLNFVILSFGLIQIIIIQKKIDFKLLSFINIASSIIAGGVALYLAFKGFAVWSLVVQMLVKSFIITTFLWIFNKWRPEFVFKWKPLKQLFSYGSKLTLAGLINTIFRNISFIVIGKLFPLTSLGYYTRAVQLQELPVITIASIFQRVAFPIFASIQDDNERLKNAIRKTLRTMVFFTFPILFGLIAISDELIEVLLTDKWIAASDYFKLFCLMGLFYTFHVVNSEIMKTKGRSDLVLILEIITKFIWALSIFISFRWGITAIIIGLIISVFIAHVIESYIVWKIVGYSIWQQLKDIFVYLALSVMMYICVVLISQPISNQLVSLVMMILSGGFIYIFGAWILKQEEIKEAKNILNKLFLK